HDPDLNRMSITVGGVRPTPPRKIATANLLPGGGGGPDEGRKLLARNKGELRRAVSKKLTLKYAPDLRFQLDETFDRMDDTRRLFAQDVVREDVARDDDAHRDTQD
ncbi:MAG: ribosome-binding factor A, partial [Pseudomonadota bacterium]